MNVAVDYTQAGMSVATSFALEGFSESSEAGQKAGEPQANKSTGERRHARSWRREREFGSMNGKPEIRGCRGAFAIEMMFLQTSSELASKEARG